MLDPSGTQIFTKDAFPLLVGDIGGTNARFAVQEHAGAELVRLPSQQTADHRGFDDAVEASLAAYELRPRSALLAAAGPLQHGRVDFTNSSWVLDPKNTMRRAGIDRCVVLNDFEAQALALPCLDLATDCQPIGPLATAPDRTKVVLGPGTGLGVGLMIRSDEHWIPVPGEGGHISLAPESKEELALWSILLKERPRVSAETLLSGNGLVTLYRAVATMTGLPAELDNPAAVVAHAGSGEQLSDQTLTFFARFLGRVAGDFALTAMARGGVYLSGGVSRRIGPYLSGGEFRTAFESKDPHEALMGEISTFLVTASEPALTGLAALASAPSRYRINLTGRIFA